MIKTKDLIIGRSIYMSKEEKSVQETLILATVACIEKQGIDGVTIRSIAQEANVNSAAINYYFGSKDILIEKTLNSTLDNAAMDFHEELLNATDLKTLITNFLMYTFEGTIRFPEICKAHFYDAFVKGNYEGKSIKILNDYFVDIIKKAKELKEDIDEDKLKLDILQMFSAVAFLALMPEMFKQFSCIDLKSYEGIKLYVESLVKTHLKSYLLD